MKLLPALLSAAVATPPAPSANCPGRCWKASGDKCVIDASAKCSSIKCDHDKMEIEFDSDLFNVEDNQKPNPFGDKFQFDVSDKKWKLNCPLGGCGMDASCEDVNDNGQKEHIVFNVPVENDGGDVVNVLGKEVQLNVDKTKVEFQCAYPITVNVESDKFTTERQPTLAPTIVGPTVGPKPVFPVRPVCPITPVKPNKPVNPPPIDCKVDCDPVFPVDPINPTKPILPVDPTNPTRPIGPCWPGPNRPSPKCKGTGPGTPIWTIHPGPGDAKGRCVYNLDPKTKRKIYPMDPKTRKPIFYINPETCKPEPCVDPETGEPEYPGKTTDEEGKPIIDPETEKPIDPDTATEDVSN